MNWLGLNRGVHKLRIIRILRVWVFKLCCSRGQCDFILTAARRLFLETHTRLVRQRRRSSDVTESRGRHRLSAIKLSRPVQENSSLNRTADPQARNMVKIFMKPASAQKPGKENDDEKIAIPEGHVSLHTLLFLTVNLICSCASLPFGCVSIRGCYVALLLGAF